MSEIIGNGIFVGGGGGGSTFAFATVIYTPGYVCTATDGVTTLTSDSSGEYIFAIPNSGLWTFSCNGVTKTVEFTDYGASVSGIYVLPAFLYQNGTEIVQLDTVGNATKNVDNIQFVTGGGVFSNYIITSQPINIPENLHINVKFRYKNTDYSVDADLSQYTGNKYISFGYYSGQSFNVVFLGVSNTKSRVTTIELSERTYVAIQTPVYLYSM